MTDRNFVYVDGESHFIRSENAWRSLHGDDACLGQLRYVGQPDDRLILFLPKAKVFWTRKMSPGAQRSIYFTAVAGDDVARHEINVSLRDFGVEPAVVAEVGTLAKHRSNVLKTEKLIEKPKGVDIALATKMLEDAFHQAFDVCHLYTSDVDFLPVIQAVKARGKQVYVHGYKNGLSERSPLLYVPDRFVDLEDSLRSECELLAIEPTEEFGS